MKQMGRNTLRAHRSYNNNNITIATKPKRSINTIVHHTGTVTKLGNYTQPNGLDRNQQQLALVNEALVDDNQIASLINENRPSAEMKLKTTHNGHETTELSANNVTQNSEEFKRGVNQLVDTAGNGSIDQVKASYNTFSTEVVTHLKNLWVDSISKLTEIEELAVDLGAIVSVRLITPLSNQINNITRSNIFEGLSVYDNLYIITIDRFEIIFTDITSQPFFDVFLPKIHNLLISINSYELSGYELYNTSYWLINKLGTPEEINGWLNAKNDLIFMDFYSDMNDLLDLVQFLGEGAMLAL